MQDQLHNDEQATPVFKAIGCVYMSSGFSFATVSISTPPLGEPTSTKKVREKKKKKKTPEKWTQCLKM